MQATIEIDQNDKKKLVVAATINQVQFKGVKNIADKAYVSLSFRSATDLFKTGRMMDKVTGNELDEAPAAVADAPAKNAAKK